LQVKARKCAQRTLSAELVRVMRRFIVLPVSKSVALQAVTLTVMAGPALVLAVFVGVVCTASLVLGAERRAYALKWSGQVMKVIAGIRPSRG
jgi:hypothetical protein